MFLRIEKVPRKNAKSSTNIKVFSVALCDYCNTEFRRKFQKEFLMQHFTFCCKACKNAAQKKENCLEQHFANTGKYDNWQTKIQQTLFDKHGITNSSQLLDHWEKSSTTMIKRYGVTNMLSIPEIMKKAQTSLATSESKLKREQTIFERYGVKQIGLSKHVIEKRKQTLKEKHGVENPGQMSNHMKKCALTMNKNSNGKKREGKAENKFYNFLLKNFSSTEHQCFINGWHIDFYIPEVNTYVQFDGVYWHGLDKPIELIENSTKPRDISRAQAFYNDLEQNAWFKQNNLKLVRITDKEFQKSSPDEILAKICN